MKVKHIWGKIPDNWRMSSQSEYDNCCPKKYYSKLQSLWQELRDKRCLFIGITKLHRIYPYNLSIYSEKATKFAKSSPYFWPQYIQSKVRWKFRKILWPSWNIWTIQSKVRWRFRKILWPSQNIRTLIRDPLVVL